MLEVLICTRPLSRVTRFAPDLQQLLCTLAGSSWHKYAVILIEPTNSPKKIVQHGDRQYIRALLWLPRGLQSLRSFRPHQRQPTPERCRSSGIPSVVLQRVECICEAAVIEWRPRCVGYSVFCRTPSRNRLDGSYQRLNLLASCHAANAQRASVPIPIRQALPAGQRHEPASVLQVDVLHHQRYASLRVFIRGSENRASAVCMQYS